MPEGKADFGTSWPPPYAKWAGLTAPAVHSVPLDAHVWSYLARDQARTIRSLARTHWGHNGLAAAVHRDEPPHRNLTMTGEVIGYGRGHGREDVLRSLSRRPETHEPWLPALIGEIRDVRGW